MKRFHLRRLVIARNVSSNSLMTPSIRSLSVLALVLFVAGNASAMPYVGKAKEGNTRMTYPSAFSVELLGRGMLGSLYFDEAVTEDLVAGLGISTVPLNVQGTSISANRNALLIPAYVNYYFSRAPGSFYATGGLSLIGNGNDVRGTESTVGNLVFGQNNNSIIPTFGAGYENRGENGFLFRLAAYGLVGDKLTGWVGFSFGICF